MKNNQKMIVSGVGGQGGMFLVKVLLKAALIARVKIGTSEIHGLSQRGGSVYAGVTFGEGVYGFVDEGQADFLIGLEMLEAQRSVKYLHTQTRAVIDASKLVPFSVNSGEQKYPDGGQLINYLKDNIAQVIYVDEEPEGGNSLYRNIFILGRATLLKDFPLPKEALESAVGELSSAKLKESNLQLFKQGCTI
ncbi:MAG: hypothetical protein GY786_25075 [Proteobacteria bacterium]|nr:hypothetical protein [Pseudomonadota bacterium]